MRCVVFLSTVLAACAPSVALPELADQTLTFAAVQQGEHVSGTVVFNGTSRLQGEGRRSACLWLDPAIRATLYGAELEREGGACGVTGIGDRWLVPAALTEGSEDLNLVVTDGTEVARVVIPAAFSIPQVDLAELVLEPGQLGRLHFSGILHDAELRYVGADGVQWWSIPVSGGGFFTAGPGSGSGTATISGRLVSEASACKGFASCRAEVRFSTTVPARYVE